LPAPDPESSKPLTGTPTGKYVVLKSDKLGTKLIEASVIVVGEKAIVRQGSFDRQLPKADLLFVGETKNEVYRFMLAKVSATDAKARLDLARWCMFAGLRDEALAEAREILKLQPGNTSAADMARSLEESIKQFPLDGSTPATKPQGGTLVAVEAEVDVTAEGASSFASRAQPVLANQCMDCHARPDYPGAFKLIRITGFEVGPQSTKANLRATATQLKKDDPLNSPLLTKALVAHGGMKQPAFGSRQATAFLVLEAWTLQAVTQPVQQMLQPTQPVIPPSAPTPQMPAPVAPQPVLPPVEPTVPTIPPAMGNAVSQPPRNVAQPALPIIAAPAATIVPGASPAPASPAIPPVQPVVTVPGDELKVPPILPTPPSIPPTEAHPKIPVQTPVVPPAGVNPTVPAPVPPVPMIPPAVSLPKPPGNVQPAGGPAKPSEFGTTTPPKPPVAGPTGGDEFDPVNFNKPAGK
jgi:hypothetical protein